MKRSDLAGWAEYGYCASHSRFFWGLRLHLLCTLHGLPVGFALTGAKADERQTLLEIFDTDPELPAWRAGQIVITDRNYSGREFEAELADAGLDLLRPARKGEAERPGSRFFKPLRQVNDRTPARVPRRARSVSSRPDRNMTLSSDTSRTAVYVTLTAARSPSTDDLWTDHQS